MENKPAGRFVSYLRVSTQRQGAAGLGVEAQRGAVCRFIDGNGAEPLAEFVEVESGRRADRPELERALACCRAHGAVLVIAKLDRLARNVEFTARLMNSGVEFVACDFPQANRLTVHILAAVAEHEREMISQRTRARGRVLGNPANLGAEAAAEGRRRGTAARSRRAAARAADLAAVIEEVRGTGAASANAVARELNRRGVPTPGGGGRWQAVTVQRVLRRAAAA